MWKMTDVVATPATRPRTHEMALNQLSLSLQFGKFDVTCRAHRAAAQVHVTRCAPRAGR
jgi:hypothetical protein